MEVAASGGSTQPSHIDSMLLPIFSPLLLFCLRSSSCALKRPCTAGAIRNAIAPRATTPAAATRAATVGGDEHLDASPPHILPPVEAMADATSKRPYRKPVVVDECVAAEADYELSLTKGR